MRVVGLKAAPRGGLSTVGSKGLIGSKASTSGRLYFWTLQPTVDCGLCPSTSGRLFPRQSTVDSEACTPVAGNGDNQRCPLYIFFF
eukprot:8260840-Pyramimonas_sp.AAC.1